MAKNFLDQEEEQRNLAFGDGFRFGLGFFVANLLGLIVLAVLASLVAYLTHYQLH